MKEIQETQRNTLQTTTTITQQPTTTTSTVPTTTTTTITTTTTTTQITTTRYTLPLHSPITRTQPPYPTRTKICRSWILTQYSANITKLEDITISITSTSCLKLLSHHRKLQGNILFNFISYHPPLGCPRLGHKNLRDCPAFGLELLLFRIL